MSKHKAILVLILFFAFTLRLYGINWDQGQHLHPDERFLTMVGNAMKIPQDIAEYFVPSVSSLNPYNIGYQFFVYGTLPVTVNKILAVIFNLDSYDGFTLLGRFLSALFDIGTLVLVYYICLLWEKKHRLDKKIKFLAAFLYALAVLPIQLSHFFAVETFLTFFMIASFYFSLIFFYQQKLRDVVFSALFFGFALGTKITALFIFPLIIFFIAFPPWKKRDGFSFFKSVFLFILIAYLSLRLADPKFFASGKIFAIGLNPLFMENLRTLKSFDGADKFYPPAIQWIKKMPVIFPFVNIAFFGLGLPYFIAMIFGGWWLLKKKKMELFVVSFWVLGFFLYQSTQFAKTMRYFIFLYPFFAIFAALGFSAVLTLIKNTVKNRVTRYLLYVTCYILVLFWPLSFMSIYTRKHSRVEASDWINKNIPENSFLAEEHWDDGLPLLLPDIKNKKYISEQMPVFDLDTGEKWNKINEILSKADYLIFTSNRGYGSILTVPEKYPKMSKFYKDLFAGNLGFKKIKEFTSYPQLCFVFQVPCFVLKDDWAEEAFTVYDHPKVMIYKNIKKLP